MNILMVVSGGDAPGINTALFHAVRFAQQVNDKVWGAVGGFPGLLYENLIPINLETSLRLSAVSGSFLQSSREPILRKADAETRLKTVLQKYAIDAVILFGGDGTLRYIPHLLRDWDIHCIGIPTTIDNDVPETDETLGFDSACNFAFWAVDGIRATGNALQGRIFTLETLGGHTGFIAMAVGEGAGADAVLVPEYDYDVTWVAKRLKHGIDQQGQALLVYSEGIVKKDTLFEQIKDLTGIRIRSTHLGHAQRGGTPSHRDRYLASAMSKLAIKSLHDGIQMGITCVRKGQLELFEGKLKDHPPKLPHYVHYQRLNGL